ncbi:hypothetical protein HaLaN_29077 [Haematococcus lacustris]|uniref:Uncharacterized protein n=1 Tax=Haematococcus lacustris TaxID=44745 RepID=A0A6A0ABM0_HAELA|nr:hypothetical protein HaLaN_29077 [Haematococcus lacustris]
MAMVAHEERSADGNVTSVWHRTLPAGSVLPGQWHHPAGPGDQDVAGPGEAEAQGPVAGQQQAQLAGLVPAVRRHRPGDVRRHVGRGLEETLGQRQVTAVLLQATCVGTVRLIGQAKQRWPDRILALAYGAGGFSGSGTIGCRGAPVSQLLKEALRQFPAGRGVMVDEFRTSRVSSAYNTPSEALPGQPPESFGWLRPVKSKAKRSRVRGLMCSTSNNNIISHGKAGQARPGVGGKCRQGPIAPVAAQVAAVASYIKATTT